MKNHFHLRLTCQPLNVPAITPDISGMLARFEKYILAHEVSKDNIPHYHLYGETDECEKTIRSHITKICQIPIQGRGRTNAYYCLKVNEYTNPSPAYVCADGDIRGFKGYTQEEVNKYIQEGNKYISKKSLDRPASEASASRPKENTLVDMYLEFCEEVIPKEINIDIVRTYTLSMMRGRALRWWRKRNAGLLPQTSTHKRFLASAWLEYSELAKRSDGIADMEIENLGY